MIKKINLVRKFVLRGGKHLFYILIFSLSLCTASTQEEEKVNNLLIIMDSSRSMLQLTSDGKEKLWAAKTAVNKLIYRLPGDTNVGLMVFGHREKNRCDDIEIVLPVAPLIDRATIKKNLELLKPTGVTPLTTSLDKAAKHLEKFRGKSTILLLTDGKETCGGNPVELVSNISKKYGIIIIVDVVGLNVTSIEQKQLESIAKAGGGNYYSANTSYELASAVTEVVEQRVIKIEGKENKNQHEKEDKETTVGTGELGTLFINYSHILSSISIYDKNTGERVDGKVMWVHSENQYTTHLEPGMYKIELYSSSDEIPIKIENIEIKSGKKTTINVE